MITKGNTVLLKKSKQSGVGNTSDGWLKVEGQNFNLCPEVNTKDFTLCKSSARQGAKCPFGDSCKFFHSDSLLSLPTQMQKPFLKYVDSTEGLSIVNMDDAALKKIREE